jgi:hypothetical protein
MTIEERQKTEAESAIERFAQVGILALWGGGSLNERDQFRKGHGFWLYRTTPEAITQYNGKHGHCEIPGESIQNDDNASGNPYFWLMKDALELLRIEETKAYRAENQPVSAPVTLASGRVFTHRRMPTGAQEVIGDGNDEMSEAEWLEYCAIIVARSRKAA